MQARSRGGVEVVEEVGEEPSPFGLVVVGRVVALADEDGHELGAGLEEAAAFTWSGGRRRRRTGGGRGAFVSLTWEGALASEEDPLFEAFVTIERQGTLGRPLLVEGRPADDGQAGEVVIDEAMARRRGLGEGQELTVGIPGGPGPPVRLEVTGVVRHPYDLTVDTGRPDQLDQENLYLGPAFWDRYAENLVTEGISLAVRIDGGEQALSAFSDAVTELAGEDAFVELGAADLDGVPAVERATRMQAVVMLVFAAVAAAVLLLIVGQALVARCAVTPLIIPCCEVWG